MQIFIDADGCPVTKIAAQIAAEHNIPCTVICDTAHIISIPGVNAVTVDKGADSVDFKLVNLIHKGDIAVTQDYGLAAMCLSKGAFVLHQDGKQYTEENISGLLEFRGVAKKIRRAGGRLKGSPKRSPEQDQAFAATLRQMILSLTPSDDTI